MMLEKPILCLQEYPGESMSQLLPAALATSKKTQISKKKGWEQTVHTAELLYEEMVKRGKCQLGRETKT